MWVRFAFVVVDLSRRETAVSMAPVLKPAESLARALGRGRLLATLEKVTLVTGVTIGQGGQVSLETKEWEEYWRPLKTWQFRSVRQGLEALQNSWSAYVKRSFPPDLRREFCLTYFRLLDQLLSLANTEDAVANIDMKRALQLTLGFECFAIRTDPSDASTIAAGTTTIRNPSYLLSKLRMPDALDDPQFLPVITVPYVQRPELFYHYRQYRLSHGSRISLLLYPAYSAKTRSDSFRIINKLTGGISDLTEPRTHERSRPLSHNLLRPLVRADLRSGAGEICVEIVDVGAGSGSLTASLCRQVLSIAESERLKVRFKLSFVDLQLADPTRFFQYGRLRGVVDGFTFIGEDYRSALSKNLLKPGIDSLSFTIISKLLNNLSDFTIRPLTDKETMAVLVQARLPLDPDQWRPSECLSAEGSPRDLGISNSRIEFEDGRTFVQPSLSDFYRGLFLVKNSKHQSRTCPSTIYAPIRSFSPTSLVAVDGRSVIALSLAHSAYLIIEDSDLRSIDLSRHLKKFSLTSVGAEDMTNTLGLRGNHLYILWQSERSRSDPASAGEIISS